MSFSLILHGGAGSGTKSFFTKIKNIDPIFENLEIRYKEALYTITQIGQKMLKDGHRAIDVVEKCCYELENNELFNAGVGSSLNLEGKISHEAIIVDGKTLNYGAICNSNIVRNPIRFARLLLSKSIIISGNSNIKKYYKNNLIHQHNKTSLYKTQLFTTPIHFKSLYRNKLNKLIKDLDTVGVIAKDIYGNIASGSSTGGLTDRHSGRLGDTHINGISTIADNRYGAIVVSGKGENIIKHHVASNVFYNLKYSSVSLQTAINNTLKECPKCGIIGIDKKGNMYYNYNTDRMYIGMCSDKSNIVVNIWN